MSIHFINNWHLLCLIDIGYHNHHVTYMNSSVGIFGAIYNHYENMMIMFADYYICLKTKVTSNDTLMINARVEYHLWQLSRTIE